jgi:hypothetical protein
MNWPSRYFGGKETILTFIRCQTAPSLPSHTFSIDIAHYKEVFEKLGEHQRA